MAYVRYSVCIYSGRCHHGLKVQVVYRGSGPEFSSSFFFWREAKFFEALGRTKKQTDRVTTQGSFFDNLIIALPDARHFDGDPQLRWEIRLKIGDRHRMLNLFQHAVTIAFFCLFCSSCLASKITCFLLVFLSTLSQYISIKI